MTILKSIPLTPKIILLTVSVSFISWGMLEYVNNQRLKSIFEIQLNRQLDLQAQEARVRFDNYVNAYDAAIEVTISQRRFTDYLQSKDLKAAGGVKYYKEIPPWMPTPSVMRRLVHVSYAVLMDGDGNVREVYQGLPEPLPETLLKPDTFLRALSFNQSLMTKVNGTPFVITAKPIPGAGRRMRAVLIFASPLDDDFLADSQGFAGGRGIVVLLSEGRVIASNRPDVLPGGTPLSEARRTHLVMGKSFFDIGSSDLLIEFASLISKSEYEALVSAVLAAGRQNRIILILAFIVIFSVVMSRITRRIEGLTRRVSEFSEKKLGGLPTGFSRGDQLDILDRSFQHLTEEAVGATERLKQARDELELRVEERTAELSKSEERFRMVAEAARAIVYDVDMSRGEALIVRGLNDLLAYNPEEVPLTIEWWLSLIHPDDLPFVEAHYHDPSSKADTFNLEYRVRHKEGTYIVVEDTGRVVRDSAGHVVRMVGGIVDITDRKRMEATITHQAHHDLLTGLANRALFTDRLNFELVRAHRYQKQLAILFLDLDRFKTINDTLGHTTGDELLKEVAGRIKPCIRETDTIARIGGDEFTILLSYFTSIEDIARIADKIMSVFERPFVIDKHTFYMTTSIGISVYPEDGENAEILIKNADIAMYHAKELGRNTYQFYSPSLNIRTLERMILENSLRQTLEHGELELFYQPQFDIATGHVVCVEALLRWRHPEFGLLTPLQFIPLAEEIGFIVTIDEWVLRTACEQNKAWQEAGYPPICVTVNLSARQFRQPNLVEMVSQTVRKTGLDPQWLELEVSESIAMQDIEHTIPNVRSLTDLGINFSIDDFGTGYSSLSYLKKLPLQKLKIDKSFIRDITVDSDDQTIVNAVISVAHSMKLRVVAEGVETEEQLSLLRSSGCDEMQGYIGSRPLPTKEFELFLKSNGHLQPV